ncbi:hypothetical protein EVAR_49279_1 [Eumeta japonica]|uniref:Uncharacterized protein n=1 Tax=Eumeta variegata TaxID=151549 RepID=A0A4C1XN44_EUMVA|nr:hypothetical protein EVAR_49279_1 [Eumeta japonica]
MKSSLGRDRPLGDLSCIGVIFRKNSWGPLSGGLERRPCTTDATCEARTEYRRWKIHAVHHFCHIARKPYSRRLKKKSEVRAYAAVEK